MSATNRGSARVEADYYPTPGWATRTFLCYAGERLPAYARAVDPFAGDGAILKECVAGSYGYDIRPECASASVTVRDSLSELIMTYSNEAIITNPPYSRAEECIRSWSRRGIWSAWLLRLNFLGSQKRAAWLRNDMPSHVLVLPKRPSFVNGTTDATEYAWFVWGAGGGTTLDILEVKP